MQKNSQTNIQDKEYFQELISWIKKEKPSKAKLANYKLKLCSKYKKKQIPTDIEIYLNAESKDAEKIRQYVETKPTRTGSGVAIVATMTKPSKCPHGKCAFCPGGKESSFGDVPQSYTGKEPSTMRGIRNNYDPYRIIFNRLEQYIVLGQSPEKVDQIIMGGTFPAMDKRYQKQYIYYSFKAYNDFSRLFYKKGLFQLKRFKNFFELPGKVGNIKRAENIKKKILKLKNQNNNTSLEQEQKKNESSNIRCIGITVETRPDYGRKKHGLDLLKLGVTRIELGIQTIYPECLKACSRGHTLEESYKSIHELRDLGFKLNFHIMPGMPGKEMKRISKIKDIENFKQFFEDQRLKPDMLKIYPCMVMDGTKLYDYYNKGIYKPLSTKEASEIITEGFRYIPEWCRVMRVQRDIPTYARIAGVDRTNLRQYIDKLANEKGIEIKDIRAREKNNPKKDMKKNNEKSNKITNNKTINNKKTNKIINKINKETRIMNYYASEGGEFFISIEQNQKLLGFIRMRFTANQLHNSITKNSAIIRELHVYGTAAEIGKQGKVQHKGIGKTLMKTAESIAKENKKNKMIVISGVGVRGYYRKLGYRKQGPYMAKRF